MTEIFKLGEASGHRQAHEKKGFSPRSLSLSSLSLHVCMCACWCVRARAGVKTSSPITVSDHSALADDFLNPIGLPRCLLSIAFVDASLTHSCLLSPPFLISPAISFHFNNFPLFFPFFTFYCFKRPKRQPKPSDEGFWDCSVCTYKNTAEAFKCMMCDVRKGTSTR